MQHRNHFFGTFALLLLAGALASAQEAPAPRTSARLEVDNDLFAVRGSKPPTDFDYTNGTRFSLDWPSAPAALARALHVAPRCLRTPTRDTGCALSGIAIEQEIFTPRHKGPDPVAGDRPHAAWLYGAARLQRLTATGLQRFALSAGVTGPPALGGTMQNVVHRLLGNPLESGWPRQLPTRLGIAADYEATRVQQIHDGHLPSRFIAGSAGATLGTLRRALHAGVSARCEIGSLGAWSAEEPLVARPGFLYVVGGYQEALVLHDAFIEGAGGVPGAARLPWVGEANAGIGLRLGRLSAEYRMVLQGREYRAEPGNHAYGALAMSIRGR